MLKIIVVLIVVFLFSFSAFAEEIEKNGQCDIIISTQVYTTAEGRHDFVVFTYDKNEKKYYLYVNDWDKLLGNYSFTSLTSSLKPEKVKDLMMRSLDKYISCYSITEDEILRQIATKIK